MEVKTVIKNGQAVGDLLIVSGFTADMAYPYTFKTQVLDPNIFASNTGKAVLNTASLYYGTTKFMDATGSVNYVSKVLSKEIMKADGSGVGDAGNGFNYEDRTAVFKLDINKDGFDLTGADIFNGEMKKLGKITVVDTLPEGWSFVDLADGVTYELHKADGTLVTDVSGILAGEPVFGNGGRSATFTFSNLDTNYYILVKAQLSEEQYLAYGQLNGASVTRNNNVSMTGEGDSSWNPTASQEVRVNTQFLDKQLLSPGDDSSALPKWIIYFHPYGLEALKDITVTDTLPEGLSLKLNQDGTLAEGAVVITEYNDPGNGTFPSTGGTLSTIKPTYDPITRKLTFKPAAGKLYKIEYETLVSGDIKGNVVLKNHVTVEGVEEFSKEVEKSWVVSSAWARGRVERIGMLQITKLGADQSPLAGAEFGLFNSLESETPISVGTSNASGIAYLRGIPAPTEEGEVWEYYLKETKAPSDDYLLDATIYKVSVSLVENSAGLLRPLVVVEGNQPNYEDGNKLTLINYTDEEVGDLTVKKTVENGEEGKEFKFIITINHTSVKGKTFATEGALSAITFDSEGKAEITLKDGESITIRNLPNDANYTVEEEDYSAEYKTQVAINEGETVDENAIDGTIVAEEEQTVNFTNSRRLGDLVLKKVAKYSEEANREFEFTITLDNEKLLGAEHTFAAEGKANSITFDAEGKANINLKDNEYLKILDLPHGTGYTITEADYSTGYKTEVVVGEGETLESNTATGEVIAEETQSVNYTNTRRLGNLLVFKTVELSEEFDRAFEFTITLDNEYLLGEEHTFAAEGKLDSITFDAEGKAVVNLMADEYIEIIDLPQGTGYTITEADYSVGYETKISYNEGEAFEGTIVTDEILAEETQGYNYINMRRLGSLGILKIVELSEESDRAFEFTITLDNEYLLGEEHTYRADGPDGLTEITFDAEGKAVISLLDDENLAIYGLPQGTGYTVTEADYSTGYKTKVIIDEEVIEDDNTTTGEILADQMPNIEFINTRRLGNLTITKIVEDSEESDRVFEFTITLDNEYLLDEERTYPAEGVEGISEVTFDAEGKAVVNLKNDESLTIFNLPQGTGYTVTEADYSENYHTQVAANEEEALEDNTLTGEILAEQTQNVTFTNSRRLGDLTITKWVENSEESDREFEFTITLDNENLKGQEKEYPAEGKLDSVTFDEEGKVTVTLKHGESLTILNLPQGTGYTVTEADYSESYITEVAVNEEEAFEDNSAMGEILAEDVQTVTFTNSRRLGDLTIHKTVKDSEEVNREFEFTITLHNDYLLGEEHAYAVEEREEPIVFDAEGKAVVTLKADERLTILSLPQGTGYTVTEADYSENYYTQVSVNTKEFLEENTVTSVILAEALESVEFVNTRKLGDLTISKIVKNGNEKEAFEFTIELSNKTLKDTVYMASGKTDFVTFDKDAKATIKLAHGESVTIHNLPKGTEYTVTEADYSKDYTTKVAVNNGKQLAQYKVTGNITDEINQSVLYTNTGIDKTTSSTTNKTSSVARTGDNSRNAIVVEMMIMLLALLVIVSTVVRRRNR